MKMWHICLPNINNFINSHNQKILKAKNVSNKDCNCMNNANCPFNGHCLSKDIYKATVCWPKGSKEYVGSSGVCFSTRFNQHKHSQNNDKWHQTMLSKVYKSNKNSITQLKSSILGEIKEYIPNKSDDCSICNLKRMVIVEMGRETH